MIPHLLEDAPNELAAVAREPRLLLALDFDGTISRIAPTPEEAAIYPLAAAALEELLALGDPDTAVAVVSGRPVVGLADLVPPIDFLVGLHGLEIHERGEPPSVRLDTTLSDLSLERLRGSLGPLIEAGARLEDKGHALALHVRGLEPGLAARLVDRFIAAVGAERAGGAPIEWVRGKAVVEARPRGVGKHRALEEILQRLGGAALIFAGDDTTDEEVFAAYPRALTVAVMDPPRQTAARSFLRSPAEVAEMVRHLCRTRRRRSAALRSAGHDRDVK